MFESILKFKIKWPKGFDPVATDLVKKLLKIDPAERLSLEAMLEHPFFEKNEPLRPITASVIGKKIDPQGEIQKGDYKVIINPSREDKGPA